MNHKKELLRSLWIQDTTAAKRVEAPVAFPAPEELPSQLFDVFNPDDLSLCVPAEVKHPEPESINLKPQALSTELQALNPKPQALISKPNTLSTKPQTPKP